MFSYTDKAELVFQYAKDLARRFGHCEVHAIHILYALMQEGSGVAANVLKNHSFSAEKVEQRIKSNKDWFFTSTTLPDDLPWSKFAQFATREAAMEAHALHHSYIGTEHILLAMTKLPTQQWFSLASEEDLKNIRQDVLSLLSPGKEEPAKSKKPPAHEVILEKITHNCNIKFPHTPDGLLYTVYLIMLFQLLREMHIPQKELSAVIEKLESIKPCCPIAELLVLIEELKKDLQEA